MEGLINIIITFWIDVINSFNNVLSENTDYDLKLIILPYYENTYSIYDYLIFITSLLTFVFVFYLTYKVFKWLFNLFGGVFK